MLPRSIYKTHSLTASLARILCRVESLLVTRDLSRTTVGCKRSSRNPGNPAQELSSYCQSGMAA